MIEGNAIEVFEAHLYKTLATLATVYPLIGTNATPPFIVYDRFGDDELIYTLDGRVLPREKVVIAITTFERSIDKAVALMRKVTYLLLEVYEARRITGINYNPVESISDLNGVSSDFSLWFNHELGGAN